MNKFFVGILVAGGALSVNAAEKKIVITGSSTIAPLAANLAKAFEKKNAGTRLNVQAGGSSRGIADARAGLADIGMVSRALNPDEKDFMAFTVALDGIVIILNKKNLFEKLTNEQIISIYKGETKNCKDVGGKDAPITVVNKAEGRSTLELFLNCFKFKNTDVKAQVAIAENEQGIKTVAGNPNAVG